MATQILVTWTYALTDHTGFLLQRSVDTASTWPVNVVTTASVTQYTDSDVAVGGTYWYHVAATNPYGTGSFSNTANVYISMPGPVTLSLTINAVSDNHPYDGTTSSYQSPIISSGSLALGDSGSFFQYFSNKKVAANKLISLTGSIDVMSGNAYDVTSVPAVGNIWGPSASFDYIVIPTDTDLPINDGWFLDIRGGADSGSQFLTQEYLSADNLTLTMTSSNCVNWSAVVTNSVQVSSNAYAIGAGRVVGIGIYPPSYDATDQLVQYSDDFGTTWNTSSMVGLSQLIFDIIYDGTRFVACGDVGTILTSSNGVTWSVSSTSGTDQARRIIYESGSGRYTVVGANAGGHDLSTGTIYTSTDLSTWTAVSSSIPTLNGYWDVAYSPSLGIYLAVGEYGLMATSSNGVDWMDNSNVPPIYDDDLTSVTWNSNGAYFAVSNTAGYIFASNDGITWSLEQLTPDYIYYGSYYFNVVRMVYYPSINKTVVFGTAPPT